MKISLIVTAITLSACAPMPTMPTISTKPQQIKISFKEPQKLSIQEKKILTSTGYSLGTWSKDCSNKNSPTQRIYEEGDKYLTEYSDGGKLQSRGQFYEVVSVSPQVIQFKLLQTNIHSGHQYLTSFKSGILGNRRLTFDATVISAQGPSAGKEQIIIKDGYEVNQQSNSRNTKGLAVTPYFKCS